jgi:hypothetical protein
MLTYDEEEFADEKKQLAQYEENLLRKQLTLLETCTSLGKAKEAYLTMYPETGPGKASPKSPDPGRLPYARVASQMLGKSKSTIEKYVQIYTNVLKPFAEEVAEAQHNRNIFTSVEQLASLAQQSPKDIPILLHIIANPDEDIRSLQEARDMLEEERAEQAYEGEQQPPVSAPGPETNSQGGDAPEQSNATAQEPAKSPGEKPVPAPSPLQEWLARVHDFGAKFNTIATRYYAENDAYKAALFLKYREEIRQIVQQMFPSAADQNSLYTHWHSDSENRVVCSFTYESKEPRYELRLNFSLTKAVHSKSR